MVAFGHKQRQLVIALGKQGLDALLNQEASHPPTLSGWVRHDIRQEWLLAPQGHDGAGQRLPSLFDHEGTRVQKPSGCSSECVLYRLQRLIQRLTLVVNCASVGV